MDISEKNTVASKPLPVLLAFIVAISLCCIRVKFFAFLGNYRDYHGIIQSSTVVSYFNIVAYFNHWYAALLPHCWSDLHWSYPNSCIFSLRQTFEVSIFLVSHLQLLKGSPDWKFDCSGLFGGPVLGSVKVCIFTFGSLHWLMRKADVCVDR